ncbi:CS domain containing protein [Tritrichomonas foetus]|uniref:CS domain containing protein n=1 Tax=Tritrichomonas foetus TaxID=1144522 RepID=A0A1J4KEA2_9EUKA|nr:CS domain containing protein [Tritrichomonas foetus]|eukprot:OHT08044.1 CS domain containing protein [Tritrichomonas foetus]
MIHRQIIIFANYNIQKLHNVIIFLQKLDSCQYMDIATQSSDKAILSCMKRHKYHLALILICQLLEGYGKLSKDNQIRFVECLISTGRSDEALRSIKKFMEKGNKDERLLFLKGCAHFYNKNYIKAQLIFNRNPNWNRWSEKAKIMMSINFKKTNPIQFGEPTKIPLTNLPYETSVDDSNVCIIVKIPGLAIDNVKCKAYPTSMDLIISDKDEENFIQKNFEFYGEILPKTLTIVFNLSNIEIKVQKADDQIWPTTEINIDTSLGLNNLKLEKIINSLDNNIQPQDDQTVAEEFEKVHSLLKENCIDF